ncbi:LOW QUALITY PROTEIN: uncharacterized protein LOC133837046 [Drosophila sulfurigaster albostrigata]|uniref:LOW QUALITY PROTEIN: uncharacterized protein LOC133837046 n=1 Tax=Drosophila sulfurigaster albostrigata TaxID=89887 RepID=UPI002D21E659|nr:LOW QUALITY PROTEIN: uncharacterized protein LOC133837046 [Drosophila sulfurigaster albostrigata]
MEHQRNIPESPEWLDQHLFVEFLKQDIPNFKSIDQFVIEETCAKGENFTTLVLRVKFVVNIEDDSQVSASYIVKLLPTTLSTRDMIASWKVFDKEKLLYSQYVPHFEEMYAKANKKISFGAKYYELHSQKAEELIVLEDLRNRGFKNTNRQIGLDLDHTQIVLEKLAQFHAASAVYYELKGPYPNLYDRNLCSEEDKFQEFRDTQANSLIAALPLFEAEHLTSALKSYTSRAPDMYQAFAAKFDNEFRCLNHGDFYCNNIMFQYDESGRISETYFIDLQMSRYCSPAQDLIYFILSSVSINLKLSKFDYLISFYHSKLVENLKLLQYSKKLPTLRDLHIAIFNHGDWAYPVISLLLPLVLIDPNEKSNMDTLMDQEKEGNQFRNTMFGNSRVIQHYKLILPWAFNRGLFEYEKKQN